MKMTARSNRRGARKSVPHTKVRTLEPDLVGGGEFISADRFVRDYQTRYASDGSPGCYVILVFDEPVRNDSWSEYSRSYVGQSVSVYKRVYGHLTGKGNGDVYADFRDGKNVYVSIVKCSRAELNSKEKELIAAFDSGRSYNRTSGGSARRDGGTEGSRTGSRVSVLFVREDDMDRVKGVEVYVNAKVRFYLENGKSFYARTSGGGHNVTLSRFIKRRTFPVWFEDGMVIRVSATKEGFDLEVLEGSEAERYRQQSV